jgi:hypothetical protein
MVKFLSDNQEEELYYLEVDAALKQSFTNTNWIQRSSGSPENHFWNYKRIKQVRNLFNLTSWAKYFEYDDLDLLRKQIIDELIFTNTSLEDIKRELSHISQ